MRSVSATIGASAIIKSREKAEAGEFALRALIVARGESHERRRNKGKGEEKGRRFEAERKEKRRAVRSR
jgi:hypothetical protein